MVKLYELREDAKSVGHLAEMSMVSPEFRELAAALGLSRQVVSQAATRGEQAAARWKAVWNRLR
jgi:hypothetical protein